MIPIILTSDVSSWSLRPMLHLLKKYWPQMPRVLIGGYTKPGFHIDADWYHIGRFVDYPVDKWSNGLLELLNAVDDEIVLFLMDDYWLNAPANHDKIMELSDYIAAHDNVLRLDLTADRFGAQGWIDVSTMWDIDDLIMSDPKSAYHFSYQAAFWRKSLLKQCVVPDESPWESELAGTSRVNPEWLVLGMKQPPLRYTIAMQQGHLAIDGGYQGSEYALPQEDALYIMEQGWIPQALFS